MIEALRITLGYNATYEHAKIYNRAEQSAMGLPDLFEEAQVAFTVKEGTYILPDYKIQLVQLCRHCPTTRDLPMVKRIMLMGDLVYQDCFIIEPDQYHKYNIPNIFSNDEQFVFCCKDGVFVLPDYSVNIIQV
jgi:hypothetical protein